MFNQIPGFFDQQCHWKEPINIFDFLHGDNHWQNLAFVATTFGWWLWPGVPLICPIIFHDSLIINISGWNQLLPLSDHCHLSFFYFPTSFIKLSRVHLVTTCFNLFQSVQPRKPGWHLNLRLYFLMQIRKQLLLPYYWPCRWNKKYGNLSRIIWNFSIFKVGPDELRIQGSSTFTYFCE